MNVWSRLTMQTERDLRGTEPRFELIVDGGILEGKKHPTSPNAPQPVVGGRYLVALSEFQSDGFPAAWPDGTNLTVLTVPITLGRVLAPVETLRGAVGVLCGSV